MNVRKRTIVLLVLVVVLMSLPFYSYEWSLFMHIFGAIVFVGNIIVTAVWMTFAKRSSEPDILRFAVRGVIGTDVYFTTPGFLLVLLNGGILGTGWFRSGQASWIWTAIALFVLSGIVWFAVLIPVQLRMDRIASAGRGTGENLPPEFYSLLARWYRWGGVATFLPLAVLIIMVLKPRFW